MSTLVLVFPVVALAVSANAADPVEDSAIALEDWQAQISDTPVPGSGCFEATFPDLTWATVDCNVPEDAPPVTLFTIGNGNDWMLSVPGGSITQANGSFSTSNVLSETDSLTGAANYFTIQLNSNTFVPSACSNSPNPSCFSIVQFVYQNSGTGTTLGYVVVQSWIIHYDTTCPPNWTQAGNNCVHNTNPYYLNGQSITNLANMKLSGSSRSILGSTNNSVQLTIGGSSYTSSGVDYATLRSHWNAAEFNVFGWGNSSQAIFNTPSWIGGQITMSGSGTPSCWNYGTTGETNNMFLNSCTAWTSPKKITFSQQR